MFIWNICFFQYKWLACELASVAKCIVHDTKTQHLNVWTFLIIHYFRLCKWRSCHWRMPRHLQGHSSVMTTIMESTWSSNCGHCTRNSDELYFLFNPESSQIANTTQADLIAGLTARFRAILLLQFIIYRNVIGRHRRLCWRINRHFRVSLCLCFIASPSAKPFL